MNNLELLEDIKEIFKDHPQAVEFLVLYNEYIHKVDDLIDDNGSFRDILKVTSMASALYTMPFWVEHGSKLLLVDQLINNQYADSVEWESSKEEWMQQDSKCLCHSGYNMNFAVILMIKGYDSLRKISSKWRERAHRKHLKGEPDVRFNSVDLNAMENCR